MLAAELRGLLSHERRELPGREVPHPLSGLLARGREGPVELLDGRGGRPAVRRLGVGEPPRLLDPPLPLAELRLEDVPLVGSLVDLPKRSLGIMR